MNKILLILSLLFVSINVIAYDIAINGIYYNINKETKTAEVTYKDNTSPFKNYMDMFNYMDLYDYIDMYNSDDYKYFGKITIPESIKYENQIYKVVAISDSAFYNCINLIQVNIPNSVTSIGNSAFGNCIEVIQVNIPNSVTSLGNHAFDNCQGLTSINIPSSVTNIGESTFKKCTNLTHFLVNPENKNFTTVNGVLVSKNKKKLISYPNKKGTSYRIPDGIEEIDFSAFAHTEINSISFPNSLTTVYFDAFYNCEELTSIIIPPSVKILGLCAFHFCGKLKNVTLSNKLDNEFLPYIFDEGVTFHYYVDLGLPSGTLWATTNVGASDIDEYGDYYAWGETTTKSDYTESNYSYHSNPTTLPLYRDVAYSKWGDNWRIPTMEEFRELFDSKNTTITWGHIDNVYGCKITSLWNGNWIFLPAADCSVQIGLGGHYWSNSIYGTMMAQSLHFYPEEYELSSSTRYTGLSIRPVMTKKFPSYTTTNSSNLKTKKITSSSKATATIHKIWCEKNSYLKLIKIYLDFTVKNIDKIGRVTAYFYTESGEKLKDTNGKCCTTNGHVCVSKGFETEAYSTRFDDFMIYFHLNELHVTQRGNYKFFVEIKDNNSNVIGRSEWVTFSY